MSLVSTLMSLSLVLSGTASRYAPGVMEATVRVRQAGRTHADLPKYLPPVDGFVALAESKYIGRVVFARPYGKGEWEALLVADCASKTDQQSETDKRSGYLWMKTEGIIAEVDHATAKRWGKTWGGIPIELIIPPENAFVFPSKLGGVFPEGTASTHQTLRLANFTIFIPEA